MHSLTNHTAGPKGVHTKTGLVFVAPGQSAELDVSPEELKSAKATGWFDKPGDAASASVAAAGDQIADPNKAPKADDKKA